MKIILLTFFLLFNLSNVFSQDSIAEYQALYSGQVNVTGGKIDDQYAQLVFTPSKSVWYQLPANVEGIKKDTTIQTNLNGRYSNTTFYSIHNKKNGGFVYKNFKESLLVFEYKTIFIKQKGQDYFYSDSLHPMVWKLESEKKLLVGKECFKAETDFRGRHYTAWYAPSIPVPNGPWKFGGLPGLILEIYETGTRSIYWKMVSLDPTNQEIPSTPSYSLNFPGFKQMYRKGVRSYIEATEGSDSVDPNCPTCTPKVKVQTIENLF